MCLDSVFKFIFVINSNYRVDIQATLAKLFLKCPILSDWLRRKRIFWCIWRVLEFSVHLWSNCIDLSHTVRARSISLKYFQNTDLFIICQIRSSRTDLTKNRQITLCVYKVTQRFLQITEFSSYFYRWL